ncbi:hypothetical protein DESC_590037 [Desulfosarcina cetonica]|nr:hypothetical protein DESC_590037 [Desulfosarcina cetonica]
MHGSNVETQGHVIRPRITAHVLVGAAPIAHILGVGLVEEVFDIKGERPFLGEGMIQGQIRGSEAIIAVIVGGVRVPFAHVGVPDARSRAEGCLVLQPDLFPRQWLRISAEIKACGSLRREAYFCVRRSDEGFA